jgi:hypothetical protein
MSEDKKVEPETILFRTFAIKGLDLRDYFAAKAMQGIISASHNNGDVYYEEETVAEAAYKMADEMIVERAKGE